MVSRRPARRAILPCKHRGEAGERAPPPPDAAGLGPRRRCTVGKAPVRRRRALCWHCLLPLRCPSSLPTHRPPCRAGSKTVFLAIDAAVSALRQAEQLVSQVRGGGGNGAASPRPAAWLVSGQCSWATSVQTLGHKMRTGCGHAACCRDACDSRASEAPWACSCNTPLHTRFRCSPAVRGHQPPLDLAPRRCGRVPGSGRRAAQRRGR